MSSTEAAPAASGLTLYHRPRTRSFPALWMLEEVGLPYHLERLDPAKDKDKAPEILELDPAAKVPLLLDGEVAVAEAGAIVAYLGDRYALGQLAPALDAPERGPYLTWLFYGPSCLEPALTDRALGRETPAARSPWGSYDSIVDRLTLALDGQPWLLGEAFTAADVLIGSIVHDGYVTKQLPDTPAFTGYLQRLAERPALKRALQLDGAG